jgi:hypothetical protein
MRKNDQRRKGILLQLDTIADTSEVNGFVAIPCVKAKPAAPWRALKSPAELP